MTKRGGYSGSAPTKPPTPPLGPAADVNPPVDPWLCWEDGGEPDTGRMGMHAAGIRYRTTSRQRLWCRLRKHRRHGVLSTFTESMPLGGGTLSAGPWCEHCGQLVAN